MKIALAGLLLLAGCGTTSIDATGALVGSWGGPNRKVTASTSEVFVSLPCMRIRLEGPIQVASDGSFAAIGTVDATSWLGGVGTPAPPSKRAGGIQRQPVSDLYSRANGSLAGQARRSGVSARRRRGRRSPRPGTVRVRQLRRRRRAPRPRGILAAPARRKPALSRHSNRVASAAGRHIRAAACLGIHYLQQGRAARSRR